ncbi:MAG: AMP-binding protein, partial [Geminicoccaceae bacterium]|nr:AMP-binding protein [Geminicoccaceae bacterium]
HRLLPDSGLFVVGEHFQRVEHCLLAPRGATLATLKRAHSHPMALGQVLHSLRALGLEQGDTVACVLPNGLEFIELYLAALQIGLYFTPINHHLVGPEIAYI